LLIADALQCTQDKGQARVISQKTRTGRSEKEDMSLFFQRGAASVDGTVFRDLKEAKLFEAHMLPSESEWSVHEIRFFEISKWASLHIALRLNL
jgi:hypothetical protein